MTTKYTPERYEKYLPYNGVQCEKNQVLAPFVIRDRTMRLNSDFIPENLITFRFYGKPVLVGFVPVYKENFDDMLKIFNLQVNEYLNRYKLSLQAFSLDEMFDNMNNSDGSYDPTGMPSHEENIMMNVAITELIEEVYKKNERYGRILQLILNDETISKQDIISRLSMKKTQGYDAIKKAQTLAKKLFMELN